MFSAYYPFEWVVEKTIVSPEECSLAYDEAVEVHGFEPELSVLINLRYDQTENSSSEPYDSVIKIGGRMTISF